MKIRITRILAFLTSAALIVCGLMMGQHHDVLTKAVTVCLECIGIG